MDVQPIYCAEQVGLDMQQLERVSASPCPSPHVSKHAGWYLCLQIVVPPDLADILKAYTKEIIRRQPGDIIEFSAKYVTLYKNRTS